MIYNNYSLLEVYASQSFCWRKGKKFDLPNSSEVRSSVREQPVCTRKVPDSIAGFSRRQNLKWMVFGPFSAQDPVGYLDAESE